MPFKQTVSKFNSELKAQKKLGVKVEPRGRISHNVPSHGGLWYKTTDATVVFVDIKGSTKLVVNAELEEVAEVYTYFVRGMAVVFESFKADYVDVQGDGLFGIFSGNDSMFRAIACAITMNTVARTEIPQFIKRYPIDPGRLTIGIGIDKEEVWVRHLGLKSRGENEVWAGKPVNMASKLSSRASFNQILISGRVHRAIDAASEQRRTAILQDCKCKSSSRNNSHWRRDDKVSPKRGFDFNIIYRTGKVWCTGHADELCETVVNNKRLRI